MYCPRLRAPLALLMVLLFALPVVVEAQKQRNKKRNNIQAAPTTEPNSTDDFEQYGIYQQTAPRPKSVKPVATQLPLKLHAGDRIALIGNTLLERMQHFGHFEALLQQTHTEHELVVRNLCWPADTPDLQPRPENFADVEQHLFHERADVIFAAFGFNESFAGEQGLPAFRKSLSSFVANLKSKAFNGETAPRIVLVSPIANENVPRVAAADLNNERIALYAEAVRQVAAEQQVGFVDVFAQTQKRFAAGNSGLTFNGCHLTEEGYAWFAQLLFAGALQREPPAYNRGLLETIVDKNNQFLRRYRPVNTFYYTGGRRQQYGYLDFLPAMRNFDLMTANRDERIWKLAQGKPVTEAIDDGNVPPLPKTPESRGANRWITAAEELAEFKVDPRFEVNLFAGEEQFPDIAAPIQMRWDSQGRLWVSCSTTYPHVYPGNEPNDKLVILEDTDGDGRADKSTVFADNLHIPLSFEFGDGGVYVSEQPHLTFLQDTTGDGRADVRQIVLTGFGTEDSHHSLHDFTWTPDGDLLFRESIFHHSQVETPYGPVRQQNSGWFRFEPHSQRLTSFGSYPSTNPWGVTFDDWGQHVASHPIYAAAFHALDPPYPQQHPAPKGLRAYSGTCGHEFVDFATFPEELQGHFIKARYKPTNRIEIHKWKETEFGYDEEYVSDLIFSGNLSFIPVDIGFGPRGAMYVCDWYNPIKGHAQYSLRDERRDRHSGRIWRITAKDRPLQEPPNFAEAPIEELLELLKRPEYRYRYWAKRELRERDAAAVKSALDAWAAKLDAADPRFRHHQIEAVWTYRWIGAHNADLLRELLTCSQPQARAAATQQLRYWHVHLPNAIDLLRRAANDSHPTVRMEAIIAASYIGTRAALDAALDVLKHPRGGHLQYAIVCSLNSHTLQRHWQGNSRYAHIPRLLKAADRNDALKEPAPSAGQAEFDSQPDLKTVPIGCIPERMLFTVDKFVVRPDQPVKIVFSNPDATDHNLLIVQPGALAEVGMAANEMAADPKNADGDFIPQSKQDLILHASPMIGPTRKSLVHVMRFTAPTAPGVYPFVCTFPGHWVVMNGVMVVAGDEAEADRLLAAQQPQIVQQWTLADFDDESFAPRDDEQTLARGQEAFMKARCHQCHVFGGHGVNLGPDLKQTITCLKGHALLMQILDPSSDIHPKYQGYQFFTEDGRFVSGILADETDKEYHVLQNLLTPDDVTVLAKQDVEEKIESRVSSMPTGLVDGLTREEILDLVSYIESGGAEAPKKSSHQHQKKPATSP